MQLGKSSNFSNAGNELDLNVDIEDLKVFDVLFTNKGLEPLYNDVPATTRYVNCRVFVDNIYNALKVARKAMFKTSYCNFDNIIEIVSINLNEHHKITTTHPVIEEYFVENYNQVSTNGSTTDVVKELESVQCYASDLNIVISTAEEMLHSMKINDNLPHADFIRSSKLMIESSLGKVEKLRDSLVKLKIL